MSVHPTISDKEREPIGLIEDGEWHWFSIALADGRIVRSVTIGDADGLVAGKYYLQYQLKGQTITLPQSQINTRIRRYPIPEPDDDNGTAWDSIDPYRQIDNEWFGARGGKIELRESGDYSRAVGIDYRVLGGKLMRKHIVLKFIRLRDE